MAIAERILETAVHAAILLLEGIGVVVLVAAAVKSIIDICRRNPHVKLNFAKGIELALEFKLGSEVLRTLIVRTWDEIFMLLAIVLLRVVITVLIHWEIKNEKKDLKLD